MSGNPIFKGLDEIAAGVLHRSASGPDAVQLRNFDEVGLLAIVDDLIFRSLQGGLDVFSKHG